MDPRAVMLESRGGSVPTLVFEPAGAVARPAIVIGAEAYGVNHFTRQVASDLAGAGYVVVVPDYYRGHGLAAPDDYRDFTEVIAFIEELDFTHATLDVLAAVDHARGLPTVDPDRVVVWGYCTGGTLAMLAACLDPRLGAAVLFFPSQPTFPELTAKRPVHPIDLLWSAACPLLLIYGDQDPVLVPIAGELRQRLAQWDVDHEIRVYEGAGHAFSAPDPPLRNDAADKASWADALAFLQRSLGS